MRQGLAARDLDNEKLYSFPLTAPLPADPAFPLYINTNDTIDWALEALRREFPDVNRP